MLLSPQNIQEKTSNLHPWLPVSPGRCSESHSRLPWLRCTLDCHQKQTRSCKNESEVASLKHSELQGGTNPVPLQWDTNILNENTNIILLTALIPIWFLRYWRGIMFAKEIFQFPPMKSYFKKTYTVPLCQVTVRHLQIGLWRIPCLVLLVFLLEWRVHPTFPLEGEKAQWETKWNLDFTTKALLAHLYSTSSTTSTYCILISV